jgi:hypothetical protein
VGGGALPGGDVGWCRRGVHGERWRELRLREDRWCLGECQRSECGALRRGHCDAAGAVCPERLGGGDGRGVLLGCGYERCRVGRVAGALETVKAMAVGRDSECEG